MRGDDVVEGPETFPVEPSNVVGATIVDGIGESDDHRRRLVVVGTLQVKTHVRRPTAGSTHGERPAIAQRGRAPRRPSRCRSVGRGPARGAGESRRGGQLVSGVEPLMQRLVTIDRQLQQRRQLGRAHDAEGRTAPHDPAARQRSRSSSAATPATIAAGCCSGRPARMLRRDEFYAGWRPALVAAGLAARPLRVPRAAALVRVLDARRGREPDRGRRPSRRHGRDGPADARALAARPPRRARRCARPPPCRA